MKLLVCINRFSDFTDLFDAISSRAGRAVISPADPLSSHYMFGFHYLQHEIDVCITGFGLFQAEYKITKTLIQKKYHLALRAAFCNAYKHELAIGDIVNVIKDKPGDIGIQEESAFEDLYDLKLMSAEDFPHFKGSFINMNNSYMNVMMPYRKVVAVTVNKYADATSYAAKREKYRADVESGDGLGFVYPCMYERQPFYQLLCVESNLATGISDFELAKRKLNDTLFDIIEKL